MFGKRGNITDLSEVVKELRLGFYQEISDQLNDLVKKGLLTVVCEDPIIVHNPHKAKVEIRHNVKIECPAEQTIRDLEKVHKEELENLQSQLTKTSAELNEYKKAIALFNGRS